MWVRCRFLDTEIDGSNHGYISVFVSMSKTLYLHCFSRLSREISTRREHPHEKCLFSAMSSPEEIALKNRLFYV